MKRILNKETPQYPDQEIKVSGYGEMSFQDYLYGLAEMPSDWPEDALKAQAVAGRTYAYNYAKQGKTICTTESCQVFLKSKSDNPPDRWKSAVDGTTGKILKDAKKSITDIVNDFKKKEEKIGKELIKANKENYERERENNTLILCEKCKKGKLRILFNRKSFRYFVACNKYPDCKTIFSIPKNALIKPAKKDCETCGFPKVLAIKKARQPMEFCLNPKCPSKEGWNKETKTTPANAN